MCMIWWRWCGPFSLNNFRKQKMTVPLLPLFEYQKYQRINKKISTASWIVLGKYFTNIRAISFVLVAVFLSLSLWMIFLFFNEFQLLYANFYDNRHLIRARFFLPIPLANHDKKYYVRKNEEKYCIRKTTYLCVKLNCLRSIEFSCMRASVEAFFWNAQTIL